MPFGIFLAEAGPEGPGWWPEGPDEVSFSGRPRMRSLNAGKQQKQGDPYFDSKERFPLCFLRYFTRIFPDVV